MAENVVKIEFQADDTSTTAAFSRLNAEFEGLSTGGLSQAKASMAAWRAEAGLSEQASIGLNRPIAELHDRVGKTAANFRPASAEMKAYSLANGIAGDEAENAGRKFKGLAQEAEEVGKKAGGATSGLGAFRGTMRALRFDIFEVVAALGLMAKAVDEAGKDEASQRHLTNQGISSGAGLASAAKAENFEPHQYDVAAISLKAAGMATGDLLANVTELGKASRISGVPFEKLIDTASSMTEEFETGGIPSMAQMNELTLASKGDTQGLADQYRALEKTLKFTEQAWKVEEEAQARSHKQTTEHTSAIDSFAGKVGISAAAYKDFQQRQSMYSGDGRDSAMGNEVMKQYAEGLDQLSKESGTSTERIREYMAAGKIGYEDLISASGRYRAHQQEELEFTQKQRDEKLKLDTEAKQRSLGMEALQSVMTPSAWKDKQADLQKLSPEGVSQQIQAQMTGAMVELGKAITTWFPEIKVAMMFLAGVEIASRLAAINARFFPGAFKPPAGAAGAGGGAVAEGAEAIAGGGTAMGVGGTLATVGAMAALPIGGALLAKTLADKSGNQFKDAQGNYKDPTSLDDGGTADSSSMPASTAPTYGKLAPTSNPKSGNSNEPTTVEDPKMHELIGRLLQIFAT